MMALGIVLGAAGMFALYLFLDERLREDHTPDAIAPERPHWEEMASTSQDITRYVFKGGEQIHTAQVHLEGNTFTATPAPPARVRLEAGGTSKPAPYPQAPRIEWTAPHFGPPLPSLSGIPTASGIPLDTDFPITFTLNAEGATP